MTFIKMPRPVFFCQCGNHAWTALTLGFVTMVSPQDAPLLQERAWRAFQPKSRRQVYATTSWRSIRLHRLILGLTDDGLHGDHENGDGLDNRRPNLRPATRSQNAQNGAPHRDGSSRFRGVFWSNRENRWQAAIFVNGKTRRLGSFRHEEVAARRYDRAAQECFGQFARLNFP